MEKFTDYYSATTLGCGNNNGINLKSGCEYVFKSYYRLRCEGENVYRLFFVNKVDSTGNCRAEKKGDGFKICEAYAAFSPDKETEEGRCDITFDNLKEKEVGLGEEYFSDEFTFTYKKGGYMVLTFKVCAECRKFIPATNESVSTGRIFENGKEIWSDNFALRPAFIGIKKDKKKTVGFWGDSITQGSRTGIDKYEAWTHRIGESLEDDISFWNLGMGWARCYDAASGGVFTKKAAMCDEVFMCFGVNDLKSGGRNAEEITEDIEKACALLKAENKDITIHLLTVPPFNLSEYEEAERKKVNEYIRGTKGYFDIAACLEYDDNGTVKAEYMTNSEDAHPNGEGGRVVYEAFKHWRGQTGW
ncbi:MAG: SGNH/GDSL hydrolase family protein [Clostridia bacterium]|nr:SGNH/GDSL hydrolase family protein [Clostridia bacterium]